MIGQRVRHAPGARRRRWSGLLIFAGGLALATVTLVGLAWAATDNVRRSTSLLLERRASEVLALTSAALNRDMKGAWLSVLVPVHASMLRETPPYDFLQLASRAFARFPYPETFIVWTETGGAAGRTYAFNRSDRPAPWDASDHGEEPYPVTMLRDPAPLEPVVARLRREAQGHRPFALVDTQFHGIPYQTVARFFFSSPDDDRLTAFVAFTVNLDWVRRSYLGDLLHQVATMAGDQDAMAITVLDERQTVVATSGGDSAAAPLRERTFPLLFFEPALLSSLGPSRPAIRQWTARVQPAAGTTRATSALGAQMLLLASLAGAASLVAVLLTVRAVITRAELAAMKSEFVAAVTHELKTPLALIKLVGDTLARGRYTSPETIRDYAAILSQEERRLSHLVNNLLTYSRLNEPASPFTFDAVDVADLIEDALEPFRPRLHDLGFALCVRVDPELPQVRADRAAMLQVFANVIDNAMKYSRDRRSLHIEACAIADRVRVTFADAGAGIPAEEVPRVFDRFYRGREAREFGSGLGLAIVRRTVEQHHGAVAIESAVGAGTTLTIDLPGMKRA